MIISRQQRYSCLQCGRCCRSFYVPMSLQEKRYLEKLTGQNNFTTALHGIPCFAKRPADGGCVFQEENGLCRIHRLHGYQAKLLICRAYPFSLMATWPGEVSVYARHDCPAVLSGHGRLLSEQTDELRKLILEVNPPGGITDIHLCGLNRNSAEAFLEQLKKGLVRTGFSLDDRMRWGMAFVLRCEKLGAAFLNDGETMREVYPSLTQELWRMLPDLPKFPLSWPGRFLFRRWLSAFVRRDEEMTDTGLCSRLRHGWKILRFVFSGKHAGDIARRVGLLPRKEGASESPALTSEDERATLSFFLAKLDTLQFFAAAYYGADFFAGLKALFLSYAAARHLGHPAQSIAWIDHALGRSPALRKMRRLEADLAGNLTALLQGLP